MNIPKDKHYPEDSVQCDTCGGHGCLLCDQKGWLKPKDNLGGRRCENQKCNQPLKPNQKAVYCCNKCALDDAQ